MQVQLYEKKKIIIIRSVIIRYKNIVKSQICFEKRKHNIIRTS